MYFVDCTYTVVLRTETDKHIPCLIQDTATNSTSSTNTTSNNILWCLSDKPNPFTDDVAWSACISSNGVESYVHDERSLDPQILEGLTVDDQGTLTISAGVITIQLQDYPFNCCRVDSTVSNVTCAVADIEADSTHIHEAQFTVIGECVCVLEMYPALIIFVVFVPAYNQYYNHSCAINTS